MFLTSPELSIIDIPLRTLATALDFSQGDRFYAETTISGITNFTLANTAAPRPGTTIWLHLVADGVTANVPTFPFATQPVNSAPWNNISGTQNIVQLTYTGVTYYVVIAQAAGIAAPGGLTMETLTFTNRTANIAQDGTGLTATNALYADTFALGDRRILANTDGGFGFTITDISTSTNILLIADSDSLLEGFPTADFFTWLGGAADFKYGINGNTNSPSTGITALSGHRMRLMRLSGTLLAQRSTDSGATWSTYHTFGASTGQLFLKVNMQNTRMPNPVVWGGVAL